MNTHSAHPGSQGQPGPLDPQADRRADALINLILDAESEGQLHVARGMQAHGEQQFPGFAARMQRTREALSRLTVLPECPDFTRAILTKVDEARVDALGAFSADHDAFGAGADASNAFDDWCLSRAKRHDSAFSATRLAMAAGVLGAIAFAVVLNRVAPVASPAAVAPVGEVVAASRADLADTSRSLAGAIFALGDGLVRPLPVTLPKHAAAAPGSLTLGDAGKYEAALSATPIDAGLASAQTRVLAIIEGPIRPDDTLSWNTGNWNTGNWSTGSFFPQVAPAGPELSSDYSPRVRAWRLFTSPQSGSLSAVRNDPIWSELSRKADASSPASANPPHAGDVRN